MLVIQKKSAISVFYGLISVDGEIGEDELQKLDELGNELDPECFAGYRDEVIAEGQAQQKKKMMKISTMLSRNVFRMRCVT